MRNSIFMIVWWYWKLQVQKRTHKMWRCGRFKLISSHKRYKTLHPLQEFAPDTRACTCYKSLHLLREFAPVTRVCTPYKSLHSSQEFKFITKILCTRVRLRHKSLHYSQELIFFYEFTLLAGVLFTIVFHSLQKFTLFTGAYILYKCLHSLQKIPS